MDAGAAALEVGTSWVGGQAHGSGASRVHGHVDGVVLGEPQVILAVWSPSLWHPSTCVGDGEVMTHKYRGSQQSSREVKPKFIDSTQGEPKDIYKS
jgi:hypothetical protein